MEDYLNCWRLTIFQVYSNRAKNISGKLEKMEEACNGQQNKWKIAGNHNVGAIQCKINLVEYNKTELWFNSAYNESGICSTYKSGAKQCK